ncbi:MAG: hypothetical protein RLZZ118_1145 [Bacteroidota bacterium]
MKQNFGLICLKNQHEARMLDFSIPMLRHEAIGRFNSSQRHSISTIPIGVNTLRLNATNYIEPKTALNMKEDLEEFLIMLTSSINTSK